MQDRGESPEAWPDLDSDSSDSSDVSQDVSKGKAAAPDKPVEPTPAKPVDEPVGTRAPEPDEAPEPPAPDAPEPLAAEKPEPPVAEAPEKPEPLVAEAPDKPEPEVAEKPEPPVAEEPEAEPPVAEQPEPEPEAEPKPEPEWPDAAEDPPAEPESASEPKPEPIVAEAEPVPDKAYVWPGQDESPGVEDQAEPVVVLWPASAEPEAEPAEPESDEERSTKDPVPAAEQEPAPEPEPEPEPKPEPKPEPEPEQEQETEAFTVPAPKADGPTVVVPTVVAPTVVVPKPVPPPNEPEHTARMAPVAGETTQFLPRIPPPAKPVPPVRPVESTQVIPVFRDIPLATETTQHIPVIPGHDSRVDPAVDYDDYGTDDYAQPEPTAKDPARRRGRKRVLIAAGSLLVVLAVGVAVVFASPTVARRLGLTSVAGPVTQSPPSPVVFSAQLKPPNDAGPVPTDSGVNQALSGAAANPALGTLAGTVLDGATGNVLWDHGSTTPVAPASTNKLLTSAAALLTLGPQTTLDTTVVAGSEPGTIILVGGGDPTLSSLPAPQQSVYPGAARIDDLAAQVKAHNPGQITRILVDTSRFSGPPTAPGWDPPSASQDNYAPIQPVMLDGGRLDPTRPDTSRTYTPALAAGQALATRLGLPTSAVATTNTPTPAGAQPLAVVHSATVPDLVTNLLQISDNVLAEELGRAVALADNKPPTFTGGTEAVLDVLRRNGFDTTGVNLTDSSGLSPADRLPPRLLAQILRVAASSDTTDPRVAKLRPLLSGLPIAGSPVGDGTLAGRYQTAPSEAGKGWVRAKTGTLTAQGVYALAGIVLDTDGRVLVFALVSNGAPSATAPQIIDTMAATLRGCGCR